MYQNKTQFPREIRWFVYDLRRKGLLESDMDIDIHVGLYCDNQAMEETYTSLISCEHMTNDLLIQHLVTTAKELHRARDHQLVQYKGNPFFLRLLCILSTLNNTERREDYGMGRTSPYPTFHALYSWFYGQQDNEKNVKHFKKE